MWNYLGLEAIKYNSVHWIPINICGKGFVFAFSKVTFNLIASFFNNLLFRLMFNLVCKQSTEKRSLYFPTLLQRKNQKLWKLQTFQFTFSFFSRILRSDVYTKKRHKNNNKFNLLKRVLGSFFLFSGVRMFQVFFLCCFYACLFMVFP